MRSSKIDYIENLVRDLKGQQKDISEAIKTNEQRIITIDTFVNISTMHEGTLNTIRNWRKYFIE